MLTIAKIIHGSAIVLACIFASSPIIPAFAQSKTADSFNFDELSAGGKGNWNFQSEDETRSIRDNLAELGEYDISGSENFDLRAIRKNRQGLRRRWANQGDRPYYYMDGGYYPYYFWENRIYNYYR